ncbi:MAG: hypothetical protein Aurels2KO_45220 [Aureliella sp.]
MKRVQAAETRYAERELWSACERIADLVSQGRPIGSDSLLNANDPAQESKLLQTIASEVEGGAELSGVLPRFAGAAACTLKAAILAGQASRALDDALGHWVGMRQSIVRGERASWSSLAYPALLASTFLVSVVFVFQFVVPQYVTIARSSGDVPPLIHVLGWLRTNLWIVVSATVLVLALPFLGAALYLRRSAQQRTPLDIAAKQKFTALLAAMMLRRSVPLGTANPLLRLAAGDPLTGSLTHGVAAVDEAPEQLREETEVDSTMNPLLVGVIDELESGSISRDQAIDFVEKIASQLETRSTNAAEARVDWLSAVVTVLVAIGAAGIYVVLIYLPWTQVLMQLEETGR